MSIPDTQLIDKLMSCLNELKEAAMLSGSQTQPKGRTRNKNSKSVVTSNVSVTQTADSGSALSSALANMNTDGKDINTVLQALLDVFLAQVEDTRNLRLEQQKKHADLENRIRAQGDQLDEIQQRGLKGNIILSSPNNDGKACLIKTPQCLDEENSSVLDHALDLVKKKYGVVLPATDVQACHHLPSWTKGKKGQPEFKSVLIRVWNRVPGSAWCQLVDRIMQGGDRGTNIYANFQLTSTRSSLVYHLRKLKSEKKIFKFYTNENGQVFYKSSENAKKFKVTFFSTKQNDLPKTLTVTELINSFK